MVRSGPLPQLAKIPPRKEAVVRIPGVTAGEHGFELRRHEGRSVHRRGAGVRAAVNSDVPVGPRLARQPVDQVERIARFGAVEITATRAERGAHAATVHLDHHISVLRQFLHASEQRVGRCGAASAARAVESVLEDDGMRRLHRPSIHRRAVDVRGQPNAVAHGDVLRSAHPLAIERLRVAFVSARRGDALLRLRSACKQHSQQGDRDDANHAALLSFERMLQAKGHTHTSLYPR
jgi:hypothetical protein